MRQRPKSTRVGCPEASRLARPMTISTKNVNRTAGVPYPRAKRRPGVAPTAGLEPLDTELH
jgi:hypothetical protein